MLPRCCRRSSKVYEDLQTVTVAEPRLTECSGNQERPIQSARSVKKDVPHLILISDPGQDLDDEMAYIMLRHLVEVGMVDVRGIITTLAPAFDRARLCQGTLASLGLHNVPIGLGSDGGDIQGTHQASTFEDWAGAYMPPRHSSVFEPGRGLLYRLYQEAEPQSLTLVILASLKDAALFLREEEDLFKAKTREVIIMGGVQPWDPQSTECILLPDSAQNQVFDMAASEFFFRQCQLLEVPLVVVSRWAAYAAKVPRSCYDELAAMGSWVGCRLRNAQRSGIENLWNRACGTCATERLGLPERCDRSWFLKTFCDGVLAPDRKRGDTIWDLLVGFMQYDTIATMAAVPALRKLFFQPEVVQGHNGIKHMVIGSSEVSHNVSNSIGLARFLRNGYVNGLALNHQRRVQFILFSQPKWDNRCEELLAIVVVRTLFEMGIVDCVGIVVSPGPNADVNAKGEDSIDHLAQEVKNLLKLLGLAHVPVYVAETYVAEKGRVCGADHLSMLYKKVSPAGISLVVTGPLGAVADFAEENPTEFQQKTQKVVLLGGAFPGIGKDEELGIPTGETVLLPDEAARNNWLDLDAARRFYQKAQELLVPLVVVSRHCAAAVQIPRMFFDSLDQDGGPIGAMLKEVQNGCITKMWQASSAPPQDPGRRSLPGRCSTEWFVDTFCAGRVPDHSKGSGDIWDSIVSFKVYSLLAILITLPPFVNRYIDSTSTVVRSVTHHIIGIDAEKHGTKDQDAVRGLIFQCLSAGVLLNESKFDMPPLPGSEVPENPSPQRSRSRGDSARRSQKSESHRECLKWMLPTTGGREARVTGGPKIDDWWT